MKAVCRIALVFSSILTLAFNAQAATNKASNEPISTIKDKDSSGTATVSIFPINKQVYSDEHIDLTCKEINRDGIVFECNNKTPRDIEFIFEISLDGILQSMWSDVNESTVISGETKEIIYHSQEKLMQPEHKLLTLSCMGFVDNEEYLSFNVVDFDLGGNSNKDEIKKGTSVFTSDLIDIDFVGIFAQGIEFTANNKTANKIDLYIDNIIMNGDVDGYGSAFTIPAHSTGECKHYVTNYVQNFNGDDINSFTGEISANIADLDTITLCELNYENGAMTSSSNTLDSGAIGDIISKNTVQGEKESEISTERVTEQQEEQSMTQTAFEAATHMTKEDLTYENGKWFYRGFLLTPDDCDWLNSRLNKEGSADYGTIYRIVGNLLEGFDIYINTGESYCEWVFGVPYEGRNELVPYVENMKDLYVEKSALISVMKKLESLDSVSGDFDYEYGHLGKYSVSIEDTSACAKELMMSEEMLGDTLAMLKEYAADIQFDGNSCSIIYEGWE